MPAVALADNCADWSVGEVQTCPAYAIDRIAAFLAFAAAAVGGLLASKSARPGKPSPPTSKPDDFGTFDLSGAARDSVQAGTGHGGNPAH
jgi:hypothetical protein